MKESLVFIKFPLDNFNYQSNFDEQTRKTSYNIGFAKVWQDVVTSAAVRYQLGLGLDSF